MGGVDWQAWHDRYDRPGPLQRRLVMVRRRISEALDGQAAGVIRVLSMCAGQGRDLLGVLAEHPRRAQVRARLVESDSGNARRAGDAARAAGLGGVEVVAGDASVTTAYAGIVPVRLALLCGMFGSLSEADLRRTVAELPRLCGPGAVVIWTRHRDWPDRTPQIREMFAGSGFAEVAFDTDEGEEFGVGVHQLTGPALPYRSGVKLFEFAADGARLW